MKAMNRFGSLLLVSFFLMTGCLLMTGCQNGAAKQESNSIMMEESNQQETSQQEFGSEEASQPESNMVREENAKYEVETLLPEKEVGNLYHWVILRNNRKTINQKDVDQINNHLHDNGIDASVSFHIVKMEGYVTPESLEQIYKQLGNQMDFVSIGPDLCGFRMDEWKDHFIELSDELQNGQLYQFYATVPEIVWDANRIDDGIYSFSNATAIYMHGYGFQKAAQDKYGVENLLRLQEANGIENEDIWKELYALHNDSPCTWTGLSWGIPIHLVDNSYYRSMLDKLTNGYEKQLYAYLTDDIRFDIEKNEFVWLIESKKYIELKQKVEEFYKKGYLSMRRPQEYDETLAQVLWGNTAQSQNQEEVLWVPSWNQPRVSWHEYGGRYMHSLVYHKAQTGWEEVLNILGSDEQISHILHQNSYQMTISALRYEDAPAMFTPQIEDRYEMLKTVYEEAQENPLAGFIFNPVPIQEEWETYNSRASLLAQSSPKRMTKEVNEPNFEAIDMIWSGYEDMKEEAHIELILEEINRQYTEWKNHP